MIEAFLRKLYEPAIGHPELVDARISIWTRPSSLSVHVPLKDIAAAVWQISDADAKGSDVYLGLALRKPGLKPNQRGSKEDLLAATAMWLDVDIKGSAHAAKNLPETQEQAIELLVELGLGPDQIVNSGNGLHVYWYLAEPKFLRTAEEVKEFENVLVALQQRAKKIAARRGWHLDMTANADRVLRVPGTHNRKVADAPAATVGADAPGGTDA